MSDDTKTETGLPESNGLPGSYPREFAQPPVISTADDAISTEDNTETEIGLPESNGLPGSYPREFAQPPVIPISTADNAIPIEDNAMSHPNNQDKGKKPQRDDDATSSSSSTIGRLPPEAAPPPKQSWGSWACEVLGFTSAFNTGMETTARGILACKSFWESWNATGRKLQRLRRIEEARPVAPKKGPVRQTAVERKPAPVEGVPERKAIEGGEIQDTAVPSTKSPPRENIDLKAVPVDEILRLPGLELSLPMDPVFGIGDISPGHKTLNHHVGDIPPHKAPLFIEYGPDGKETPMADTAANPDTPDSEPWVPVAEGVVHKTPKFLKPVGLATAAVAGIASLAGVMGVYSLIRKIAHRPKGNKERRHVRDWRVSVEEN